MDPGYVLRSTQPYVCSLSNDLVLKATKELEEKEEWRERDIEGLRSIVREHTHLNAPLSDAFLLRYLRAKKFDYEKAFKLLQNYFAVRWNNKDLFQKILPSCYENQLQQNIMGFLPNVDFLGCRVLFVDLSRWKSDTTSANDLLCLLLLHLELEIASEASQVCGLSVMIDLRGYSVASLIALAKTSQLKSLAACLQGAFPLRLRGIHFVQESALLDLLMSLVRPFLSEKLRKRLHFHGGHTSSLLAHMDADILPECLGGPAGQDVDAGFTERLIASEAYFEELASFGFTSEPSGSENETGKKTSKIRNFLTSYKRICIDGLNH